MWLDDWFLDNDEVSILIMFSVMRGCPIVPADVAKLEIAFTGHVIAAFVSLDDGFALFALSVF